MNRKILILPLLLLLLACTKVDDKRIPASSVSLTLNIKSTAPYLNSIGTAALFVCTPTEKIPTTNYFDATTRTGYGGLLVVHGVDDVFYAFDLACPVEAKPNVRLYIDFPLVKCRTCGSTYDVAYGLGNPTSGEALDQKYPLTRYSVTPQRPVDEFHVYAN